MSLSRVLMAKAFCNFVALHSGNDTPRAVDFCRRNGLASLVKRAAADPAVMDNLSSNRDIMLLRALEKALSQPDIDSPEPKWEAENWGPEPSEGEKAKAREFSSETRAFFSLPHSKGDLWSEGLAAEIIENIIDLRALFLVDRELLVTAIAGTSGSHLKLIPILKSMPIALAAIILIDAASGRYLGKADNRPPQLLELRQEQAAMTGLRLLREALGLTAKAYVDFFIENNLINYAFEIITSPAGEIILAELLDLSLGEGRQVELWGTFTCENRARLLASENDELAEYANMFQDQWELAQAATSHPVARSVDLPASYDAFLAKAREITPATPINGYVVAYAPAMTRAFLDTVPEAERAMVLATLHQNEPGLCGVVVRSAKSMHVEMSNVVNALPLAVAVEIAQRELALVADEVLEDPAKLAQFLEVDNFSAVKNCLDFTDGIMISRIWDALSIEGKVNFLRIYKAYYLNLHDAIVEGLAAGLRTRLGKHTPSDLASISRAVSSDVREFLRDRNIADLAEEVVSNPKPPVVEPESWRPEFGKKPNVRPDVVDFAARAASMSVEVWGEVAYSPGAQQAFVDTFSNGDRAIAFRILWTHNPQLAATMLRTMKYHGITGEMMAGLEEAHLVHIVDSSLASIPSLERDVLARFDAIDGSAICRGLCQLETSRIVGVMNRVEDGTLGRLLTHMYVVSNPELLPPGRSRGYVNGKLIDTLREGQVDAVKLGRALSRCDADVVAWVKSVRASEAVDQALSAAKAEKEHANDSLAVEFTSGARNHQALRRFLVSLMDFARSLSDNRRLYDLADLLVGAVEAFGRETIDADAVNRLGQLWDRIDDFEHVSAALGQTETIEGRDFYLFKLIVTGSLEWLGEMIVAGNIACPIVRLDDPLGEKDVSGEAVGQIVVLSEAEGLSADERFTSLRSHQIPVVRDFPSTYSQVPQVAAVVKSIGGMANHAVHRASELGVPLGHLAGARILLRALDGKWVKLVVGKENVLRLATADEEREAREKFGLLQVVHSERNEPHILRPDEVRPEMVGYKGTRVERMSRLGLPVPPTGYVSSSLSYLLYETLGLNGQIEQILHDRHLPIAEKSRRIKQLFAEAETPERVVQLLMQVSGVLPGTGRIFRPVSLMEDRDDRMGAGELDSLTATSDRSSLIPAAMLGYASYWNVLPLTFRINQGLDHFAHLPGALIMRLIEAQAAGTMEVGEDNVVINALWGFGKGAMDGNLPTDRYELGFDGAAVKHTPAPRRTEKYIIKDGRTIKVEVSEMERKTAPISEDDSRQLAGFGQTIRDAFGPNQNSEWVMDPWGALWVVQTRPRIS